MSGFSDYFALNQNAQPARPESKTLFSELICSFSNEIFMALQAKKKTWQKSEQHCSDDFGP